jgi:hypothetical protein
MNWGEKEKERVGFYRNVNGYSITKEEWLQVNLK